MMQDKSADKQATWAFMNRQIDAAQQVGMVYRQNKAVFETIGSSVFSVFGSFMPKNKPFDDSWMRNAQ